MKVAVRAHPRAAETRAEWQDGVLHVWVSAAPAEGAANRALIQTVAETLRVPVGKVRLVAGRRSRQKLIEVDGL